MTEIRARRADDLAGCVALAEHVHATDGYPPAVPQGFESFLASRDTLAAWVAVDEGRIVGHVAVHGSSSPPVMELVRDSGEVAVVARLFVDPSERRSGLGRRLLGVATAEVLVMGRTPVLDVSTSFEPAIALYEATGWQRAGEVRVALGRGTDVVFHEYVYIYAPLSDGAAATGGAGRQRDVSED